MKTLKSAFKIYWPFTATLHLKYVVGGQLNFKPKHLDILSKNINKMHNCGSRSGPQGNMENFAHFKVLPYVARSNVRREL